MGKLDLTFPPKPTFTEKDVPSLVGKVFIVTGGNSGVGFNVVKTLYAKGATVYIAGRSSTLIAAAIDDVQSLYKQSPGHLKSLHLDLRDLTTVPTCASAFLAQETRLDVLWNNAGIGRAPLGDKTVQGHEAIMGTNCLGPFLLTKLLLPILIKTANVSTKGDVRVVFTSSSIMDLLGPPGGVLIAELGHPTDNIPYNYSASKAGNWFLASELDKRIRAEGIIALTQTVGNCKTKGWKKGSWLRRNLTAIFAWPFLHDPIMGSYTELWAGLSPAVKMEDGGRCAASWGRWHPCPREDILESLKRKDEGGTGVAAEFWNWCEVQTKDYAGL